MRHTPSTSIDARERLFPVLLVTCLFVLAGPTHAQSGDTSPTVSIEAPAEGATVNGTVDVEGTASAPNGTVDQVEIRIDDGSWETATGTENWTYAWDTTNETDGGHTVDARSWSGNNSSQVDTVNVTVDNPDPNQAPNVSIEAPAEGATVNGTVEVTGSASDPDGNVTSVEVRVDGGTWQTASGTSSWSWSWDTTTADDGAHTIEARAHDPDTTSSLDAVNVTVDNPDPNQAPNVSIDNPAEGATVDGTVDVAGSASDPDGNVTSVEIRIDGGTWHTADGTQSWSWTWDTTTADDGAHTIEARAHDGSTTSTLAERNVSVDNTQDDGGTSDPNQQPSITIDRPDEGATVEGSVQIEGRAWDPDGQITQVEVRIDGGAWQTVGGTGAWGYTWDSDTVDEGEHSIFARAHDDDGDWNTAWTSVTVNRTSEATSGSENDTAPNQPPELTVLEPRENATVGDVVLVSGTAHDPDGELDELELRLDDGGWRTLNASSSWIERWNMSSVPEGRHLLTVRVTDADGASDVVLRRIEVDHGDDGELEVASTSTDGTQGATNGSGDAGDASPSVELTSEPTIDDGELVLEGVATDPDEPESLAVEYRVDDGDWQAFTVQPGEPFERTIPAGDLAPGEHEVTVRAHDASGSSEPASASFTVEGASARPTVLGGLIAVALVGGGLIVWARHTEPSS